MDQIVGAIEDLREVRRNAEASLRVFAAAIGITESHLSRIERGLVVGLDVRIAMAINRVYGVSIDWEAVLPPLKAA